MEACILPGTLWRKTEFVGGLTGACGPNALAMAESWANQRHIGTLDVYQRMRAAGCCDAHGPATIGGLAAQASADGFATDLLPFREPMPAATWRAFFARHVGTRALIMETANGQALVDGLSGKGENARNLRYHFIVVVGWHPGGRAARVGRDLPPGWWAADGDNFAAGDTLQFYPDSILAATQPSAALAISAKLTLTGNSGKGGGTKVSYFERLPDGRGKDTRTGEVRGAGFADYCISRDVQQKCIKGETEIYPGVVAAFFDSGLILYYKQGGAISDRLGGYLAVGLLNVRTAARTQLATAQADLATATKARDAATAQVVALTAELASAQSHQPAAPDETQHALDLVLALKTALA
jgi:hypothetical protein